MTVSSDINTVSSNSIEDELGIGGGELVETLLDDVVAVEVLNKLNNSVSESIDDGLNLTRGRNELNHLLQSSSTVLVESNANKVPGRILNENSSLLIVAVLQQLLTEVIAKWIGHELNDMLIGLEPDHVDLLGDAVLQLLLQVAAAVLILAQAVD